MSQLVERLQGEYRKLKEAYNNGQQRGNNGRPDFIGLHGGRALYPYRNFRDLLTPNLQDLIHDLRLLGVDAPKSAYYLGRASDYDRHERIAYILGAYKSLVAIRAEHH